MDNMASYWQLGNELRGQSKVSEDHKWLMAASKLAEQTNFKGERMNNLDLSKGSTEMRPRDNLGFQEDNKLESLNSHMMNLDMKGTESFSRTQVHSGVYNPSSVAQANAYAVIVKHLSAFNYNINANNKEPNNNNSNNNYNNTTNNNTNNNENAIPNSVVDKRFKTLPSAETLPRNEILGGYIFVCNNDTMQDDLKRQLFGIPPRYRDSVRAITPGLPLFLYNYTTHQLLGIFEAASFGGYNIDPTAWEDKKCKGESRFPSQVRVRVRKLCKPLEEDAFRPVLHHYDGPKFRLELTVPETIELLDLCEQAGE